VFSSSPFRDVIKDQTIFFLWQSAFAMSRFYSMHLKEKFDYSTAEQT